MDVVKNIFSVAQVIYAQCEKAEVNKKCCERLVKRIKLLLMPIKKLENNPEKSREMEASLQDLSDLLQSAACWVNTYSRHGWWRKFLQAASMQRKLNHINERINNSSQAMELLLSVEEKDTFHKYFNKGRQKMNAIEKDLSMVMQSIESDLKAEQKRTGDQVDSMDAKLNIILETCSMIHSSIFKQWDIEEIKATKLTRRELLMDCASYSVYLGEYLKAPVQIKVLKGDLSKDSDYIKKTFKTESQTMRKYQSPYILRLYGICIDSSNTEPCYSLVTEFCEKGTLRELLNREPDLSWERRVLISLDAARALYRLHQTEEKAILHASLRCSKFMVDGNYCVKLSGFELSKTESSMRRKEQSPPESSEVLIYIAPEILQNINIYNKHSEIYSLGVILYEIATSKVPLQGVSINKKHIGIHQLLCEEVNASFAISCPPVLPNIIKRCLAEKPEDRPSAEEIADLLMEYMDQIESQEHETQME